MSKCLPNQMSGSHSRSIHLIETLLNLAIPQLHPYEQVGSPSYTRYNTKKQAQNGANTTEKHKKWNPADRRVQLGESPKRHETPFVPVREALKEVDQKERKEAVGESPINFVKQYCTAQ
ncbi:hypothetical protein H5410_002641 [Solanum commersonii]|uniref:Uncharacterized protein n=1 Tax=Solanum commersonii TaxID=4109 RepID=A0A9J6B2Q4_SOLCO|nr:hypothetical protein H5410_002641 [Solanum commersonii]